MSKPLDNQRGQIVVEYLLLIAVSIMVATLFSTGLVSRSPDQPGVITAAWARLNQAIASDIID